MEAEHRPGQQALSGGTQECEGQARPAYVSKDWPVDASPGRFRQGPRRQVRLAGNEDDEALLHLRGCLQKENLSQTKGAGRGRAVRDIS